MSFLSAGLEFAIAENKNYALLHNATEKNAFGCLECILIDHTGGKLTASSAVLPVPLTRLAVPPSSSKYATTSVFP